MAKTKTVKMPAGIRTKLMAAIAMLLVSTILMVSSTYAWFTLSTAPEVTGITTSVGANGNLEIALLNGQTFIDQDQIGSGQGDSTAATGSVLKSNITWGNLVDLSDAAYGLNLVALNPAALNYGTKEVTGTDNNVTEVEDTTKVNTTFLLQTAVYGADGRVAELNANTITGVYNSANGKWVGTQTFKVNDAETPLPAYGVRAIGVDSSMTAAEIAMIAAKAAVSDGASNAATPVSNAVSANWMTFLTLATSMTDTNPSYEAKDVAALKAVAEGVQSSLNTIVKTYSNAVLAKLASTAGTTDEVLTAMRSQLGDNTSAATLKAKMTEAGVVNTDYTDRLTALETAQAEVAAVLTACGSYADGSATVIDGKDTATVSAAIKEEIVKPLIGTTVAAYKADGTPVDELSMNVAMSGDIASVYLSDPNGLVSVVAVDAGTYEMCRVVAGSLEVSVYAGPKENTPTPGNLAAVASAVASMSAPAADANAEKTIADFYGYVIDFAFRTNAAESNLMLQTDPTNRVYSNAEGSNLATQGAGSTATFKFHTSMKPDQVTALLEAVRLVFMDTKDGTIHANGRLTDININTPASTATANVRLLDETGAAITAANAAIVALEQNVAKMVSVLVYLDGNKVDNADVAATAASSGMLNLNLQFSSSANLIPMENTALKNMVVTYDPQPAADTDYHVARLYTYGDVIYTVNTGYDIYKGSDGMTYFSKDGTNYTKLTAISMSEALTPLTVKFAVGDGQDNIIKVDETLNLSVDTVSAANATVKSVTWSSADSAVATVAADDVTTDAAIVVTGKAAGTTKINAAIELQFTYKDTAGADQTYTKTVNAYYTVSVTADETTEPDQEPDTGEGEGEPETSDDYTVTVADGIANGAVSADVATAAEGDTVTLTVTPAIGYVVDSVSYNENVITANDGVYSFTMPAEAVTVTATFKDDPSTYAVTITTPVNGSAGIEAGDYFAEGATVTLSVTPDKGYVLESLIVGGTDVTANVHNNAYTFTMPANDVTITATFTATQQGT